MENFIKKFENSVKTRWDNPALTDFRVSTETYADLAKKIELLNLTWEGAGIEKGSKIAINARSSSRWLEVFFACAAGKYVSVQMFNGFLAADVQNLVNHSDSRVLYTEPNTFAAMDFEKMPQLEAVINMENMEILAARGTYAESLASAEERFAAKYPNGFTADDVHYDSFGMEDVSAIMYTSGSTGNPKGVMLTVKNFSYNVKYLPVVFPFKENECYTSILPFAHIFGLSCDGIVPMCMGMHTVILGMPPIPSNVMALVQEYHPRIFLAVPLILDKFVKFTLGAEMKSEEGSRKLENYKDYPEYCEELRTKVMGALGGRIESFATGGAAIPPEVESLLAFKIKMPFLTGYGMTETAPLISCGKAGHYKAKSCGEMAPEIQYRIDSPDQETIPGELQIKGDNVFAGYYKNPEATAATFTADGWFRTGDIGTIDKDQTLFLVGRCKNVLLSSNGQNIFPEEIEVVLNTLPYVAESIIVQRDNCLHAIIVPKLDEATNNHLDMQTLSNVMEMNIKKLNASIPAYAAINSYELRMEPFAKTPKGSIRRFMYS